MNFHSKIVADVLPWNIPLDQEPVTWYTGQGTRGWHKTARLSGLLTFLVARALKFPEASELRRQRTMKPGLHDNCWWLDWQQRNRHPASLPSLAGSFPHSTTIVCVFSFQFQKINLKGACDETSDNYVLQQRATLKGEGLRIFFS